MEIYYIYFFIICKRFASRVILFNLIVPFHIMYART